MKSENSKNKKEKLINLLFYLILFKKLIKLNINNALKSIK